MMRLRRLLQASALCLLALVTPITSLAGPPTEPSYLVEIPADWVSQKVPGGIPELNILHVVNGYITAIIQGNQLDALQVAGTPVSVLDRAESPGHYYLLPVDDPGATAAFENASAAYVLSANTLLVRVDSEGEELLWTATRSKKRLFGGLPWPPPSRVAPADASAPADFIEAMIEEVSRAQLTEHVLQLQDDDSEIGWDALRSRYSLSPELDVEKEYIYQRLSELDLQTEYDPFTLSVSQGGATQIYNIVATLPGAQVPADRVYIVCAHYDSTAARTSGWDWETDPAPGADDNGTGVAALLEAARVLSNHRFAHTIRFVAFSGEEQGLWGSKHYAQGVWGSQENIAAVINLDMIAYNTVCDKIDFVGNSASEWLVDIIRSNAEQYGIEITTEKIINDYLTYSDHSSFWDYGYPAILGIEDYQPWSDSHCYTANYNYHTTSDTYDTLNLRLLEKTTQLVLATVAELAEPTITGIDSMMYLPLVFPLADYSIAILQD